MKPSGCPQASSGRKGLAHMLGETVGQSQRVGKRLATAQNAKYALGKYSGPRKGRGNALECVEQASKTLEMRI
jgi:hypothetical protein